MEAVPRLHMLWFAYKSSPEGTSFSNLKKYIAEFYQEDPDSYSKDVFALETLRNQSMHPPKDSTGCKVMKRYYCQLHSLLNRFPQLQERPGIFTFTWKDLYQNNISEVSDMRFELAAVLFNIAASHTQEGASVTRGDVDGMKLSCTHFQCAAWAFGELRERYATVNGGGDFMTPELLVFMQQVSYAQAQECILEKSVIDNRKPNIVAKVTAQIIIYYGAALAALLTGGDDGPVAQVIESSVYKLWKKYARFKISYLYCILYLYQGQHMEEQQKMGERVTLYQAAWDKLEEARKESKGLPDQKEIHESLSFTADLVEAKRKNAKNENEFIYHESVPELADIAAVQGANLVNGISFSVIDPEVAGEDIFARLVPMQAHEASSMYSEEKAKLLRKYGAQIEDKDSELATFMSSLTLDNLNISEEKANKIPQGIVDRCAALNANKSAIPELISAMSQLAEICADVETNLQEISSILAAEERQEREFETSTGVKRTPNAHITELTREFQKYNEAHARAGESNDTLRKAMEMHVNNLKILARPLQEIQQSTPRLSTELNAAEVFRDVKLILNKVNEMKAQRSQFHADLRIAVNSDDITPKVIAHGSQGGLQVLFDRELSKHERLTQLIEQNLLAQENILQALTETYAKAAPVLKTLADIKHKRDTFFSSLAASYDVYEDLLAKSGKGLEFYKKLSGNVQKLLARLKSARDVQSEERQQRMHNVLKNANTASIASKDPSIVVSNTPKLRDYLKTKNPNSLAVAETAPAAISGTSYIPTIRPNPLGSENPTQAACVSAYYTTPKAVLAATSAASVAPNEPPPPYSLQQPQFFESSAVGFNNPTYQQQQHSAPPAYSLQASPNSQFISLSTDMSNMALQPQSNYNFAAAQNAYNNFSPQQAQNFGNIATETHQNSLYAVPSTPYPLHAFAPAPITGMVSRADLQAENNAFAQSSMNITNITMATSLPVNQYSNVYDAASMKAAALEQHQILNTPQGAALPLTNPYASFNNQQEQQQPIITQYSTQQQPQLQQNYSTATAMYHNTQPLYVTTASEVLHQSATPQAPFVVNSVPATLPATNIAISTNILKPSQSPSPQNVTTKHPGYSFNSMTGIYDYDSGHHEAAPINTQFYGQYTSPSLTQLGQQGGKNSHTTDSENACRLNLSTGLDNPIISHTQPAVSDAAASEPISKSDVRYYNPPYGYQSNGISLPMAQYSNYLSHDVMHSQPPAVYSTPPPIGQQLGQQSIYIQSGRSQPITQTTKSVQYTQSPQASPAGNAVSATARPSAPVKTPKTDKPKKSSNIDLLTDIDFSGAGVEAPGLLAPALIPQVVDNLMIGQTETPAGDVAQEDYNQIKAAETGATSSLAAAPILLPTVSTPQHTSSSVDPPAARNASYDNISIGSDLSSLDQSFDWDSVSLRNEKPSKSTHSVAAEHSICTFAFQPNDPFADDKTLKYFHKEVERFEKTVESLNVKMLNGSTPLMSKYKELQDLLAKDSSKRTTTIARLFPDKNRSLDCLPYDHARVTLDKTTDNYINAAFIKDLGPGCPNFIIAQTPQENTIHDFWSMIWSQKTRIVVCLHTPNEMLDPFWPDMLETETNIDDFFVKAVKIVNLSHCSEFLLRISMHGTDEIIDLSILQIKAWTKSSPSQIIGIAHNILQVHQQRCFQSNVPLILNCLTGSERSELIAIAICAILATQAKRPLLINLIDVWYRICAQRQNALRDTQTLEHSLQIVLSHAHDVLNKRGIMTSYQMKIAPQVASKEKEEIKDPLNELDPLWKLKQK